MAPTSQAIGSHSQTPLGHLSRQFHRCPARGRRLQVATPGFGLRDAVADRHDHGQESGAAIGSMLKFGWWR
jgi:hypothetical protein